jgi:WD40 repeat protein
MKNLWLGTSLVFMGCASLTDRDKGPDLRSGEVTQVAFTSNGKYLVVANEFRQSHSRLRNFSTSDWKAVADTNELSLEQFCFARSSDQSWIIQALERNRFGEGNPIVGPIFFDLDPVTLKRKPVDLIQQGRDNVAFEPSALDCAHAKPLCVLHLIRFVDGRPTSYPAFVFDLSAGKKTVELQDFPTARRDVASPTSLAFTPDDNHIVSCHACKPYQLQLHASDTGKLVNVLKLESPAGNLRFSHDGKLLAALCLDGTLLVLEPNLSKRIHVLKVLGKKESPHLFAFIGKGHLAVPSGAGKIELFDTKEWKSVRTFENKDDPVNCVAASPDGKLIAAGFGATGQSPGFVRIWDVATGNLVKELK